MTTPTEFGSAALQYFPVPRWLQDYKNQAAAILEKTPVPTEDQENWRYSDIGSFHLDNFKPSSEIVCTDDGWQPEFLSDDISVVKVYNDICVANTENSGQGGIQILNLSDHADGIDWASIDPRDLTLVKEAVRTHLSPKEGDSFFELLAKTFVKTPLLLYIPSGYQQELPIAVIHRLQNLSTDVSKVVTAEGDSLTGEAYFPSLTVVAGSGAKVKVLDILISDEASYLVVPRTGLQAGEGAELAYEQLQILGDTSYHYGHQYGFVAENGVIDSFSVSLGAHMSRTETSSVLAERGATSKLYSLYFATGNQIKDMRTYQDHLAPHTKSELIFKGAVDDQARSVYTGLIHMAKGAVRSEASQTNRNLVLSEDAGADSVPNLSIEENDVKCSHASAVGPIDKELSFYLESKGIEPLVAEKLITLGFFQDLLDSAPMKELNEYIYNTIANKL